MAEDRTFTPKFAEIKLQGYFLHASPDYLLVGRIGNGTVGSGTAYSDSRDIYTTHLNSPASKANFYVVRQVTNTRILDTDFTLRVNTSLEGEILIPKNGVLTLAGRESKVISAFEGLEHQLLTIFSRLSLRTIHLALLSSSILLQRYVAKVL
jgi:hypothetical protein